MDKTDKITLWASYESPHTLRCVGGEYLMTNIGKAFSVYDIKKKESSSIKLEGGVFMGCPVLTAGHSRLPFLAIVDSLLMPNIAVLTLPDYKVYCSFTAERVTQYLDLRFTENDLLIGLTDRPDYAIRIWSLRTQDLVCDHKTMVPCRPHSMLVPPTPSPLIMQFSMMQKEVYMYQLCMQSKQVSLYELSQISLPKEYENVTHRCFAFSDEEIFYVINERGALARIASGQCALIPEWRSPYMSSDSPALFHSLLFYHHGFLVATTDRIIYLRSKNSTWTIEWQLDETNITIANIVTTIYNEVYIATNVSRLYHIDIKDNKATLIPVGEESKFITKDYCTPNGIKDEVILVLTVNGYWLIVDASTREVFYELNIENACCISVNPVLPYAYIASNCGKLHIFNYENVKAPIRLGIVEGMEMPIQILSVENMIAVLNDLGNIYLIDADYKAPTFEHFASIEDEICDKYHVTCVMFPEPERLMLFVGTESPCSIPVANTMWVLQFKNNKRNYIKIAYTLPNNYTGFTFTGRARKGIEFIGIQYYTGYMDLFVLRPNEQLKLDASLKSEAVCTIEGASCSKHLLTFSADGQVVHFRSHKRSNLPFRVSKRVFKKYLTTTMIKSDECWNMKYIVYLYINGILRLQKLNVANDNVMDNVELPIDHIPIMYPKKPETKKMTARNETVNELEAEYTEEQLEKPDLIRAKLEELSVEVSDLINYDISVTGELPGIFRKFCLNNNWLMMLTEQTRLLLNIERTSLEQCTREQEKIRDWIRSLIVRHSDMIHYKLRALYSNAKFENYAIPKQTQDLMREFDFFRFYIEEDTQIVEHDHEEEEHEAEVIANAEEEDDHGGVELRLGKKRFTIPSGCSAYDHVMAPEFAIQDTNSVTVNQYCNDAIKFRMILKDALKLEFNKLFAAVKEYKSDVMESVKGTNTTLSKIYDNMNIMLQLLGMDTFDPPELSMPEWMDDEQLERIMEVDDSEVVAVNRRKKKEKEAEAKVGRMLLWSDEFWVRALLAMMDGVLEKLWEEEIKKDVPIPDFMLKKSPHEYTLEDQRLLREYNERVRQLEGDRRKYLKILRENETKVQHQKLNYILKINERITEMSVLKLKYDFAISSCILRVLNTNMTQLQSIQTRQAINEDRNFVERLHNYTLKYINLTESWEGALQDVRQKLEAAIAKDKQVEKQFRGNFLASAPPHVSNDLLKLYKRRPKILHGLFNKSTVCFEMASALTKSSRQSLPLSKEALDFLALCDSLDEPSNMPAQLEMKYWDAFCKLRRLRLESEFHVKGIQLQIAEWSVDKNFFNKEINGLKAMRAEKFNKLNESVESFVENMQNMSLQITLTLGQVEVNTKGSLSVLRDTVLMHRDDINAINAMIQAAGRRKIRAMQRVAAFRRQVIFKEWEHKMMSANISYLKYMVNVIDKCKVSKEFLEVLRKWDKVKANREYMESVGVIERMMRPKINAFRKNLDMLVDRIDILKADIDRMRLANRRIDRKIDAVKVHVTMTGLQRDEMMEEKRQRNLNERMAKFRVHRQLMDTVRRNYAHILELNTILELQRLRTYPTLGPAPPVCPPLKNFE